jgi:hypothetical protein
MKQQTFSVDANMSDLQTMVLRSVTPTNYCDLKHGMALPFPEACPNPEKIFYAQYVAAGFGAP